MIGKVLVVGGGVGGMSAALALVRRGVEVELIDLDPQWRAYGAGISVTGLSLRAFENLGFLDEVRERGFVSSGIRLRAPDGSVVMEAPRIEGAAPIESGGGIMRPVLHEIMSRRVREAGIKVSLGVEPVAFQDDDDGVTVRLSDGRSEACELVVAADGIYSKTRRTLFPQAAEPKFTGQGCWRIVADRPAEVDRPEIWVGGPVKLGLNPVSQDKLYAFILEHVPDNPRYEESDYLARLDAMLQPFGGHIAQIRAGLGPDSLANYRPLEWIMLPQPWNAGRVVLMGDAVHATTPHMAAGAGLAAEDGLVLAEELFAHDTLDTALSAFAARRYVRAALVVENSVKIGEIEMAGGNQMDANRMLGDTMMRLREPY